MSEVIVNILPTTEEERAQFRAIAPDAEHIFFPTYLQGTRTIYPTKCVLDPEILGQATVLLGFLNGKPEALREAKNLKWLQAWSAGVDPFMTPGLLPEGCMLTSAVGAYGQSVAEHMLAMLLDIGKNLPQYHRAQLRSEWTDFGLSKSIRGSTVLVAGTGNLGSEFAIMCKALGAKTIGLRRTVTGPVEGFDEVYTIDQLDEMLPRADTVCLMLPHTAETVHIINRQRLALMKPDAILLNGGRGSAIDQDALVECLNAGYLWGAGLDVVEPEPLPAGSPLWQCERLFICPHIAGGLFHIPATARNIAQIAMDNLRRYVAGEPLRNRMK